MATGRKAFVNLADPGWVHCISRCVRKAFLAGGDFEHRRAWVEDRLRLLDSTFPARSPSSR